MPIAKLPTRVQMESNLPYYRRRLMVVQSKFQSNFSLDHCYVTVSLVRC